VRKVSELDENFSLIEVEALDGDHPGSLTVAVPPEELLPLPSEELDFDLSQLDSFTALSRAHRILNATLVQETGLIIGARFGRVALEAYQLAPALRLLSKPRPRLLIADDVGLGKTIEAGLAMLELMARKRVERVLVVVPPGLMDQWHQELYEKFNLSFKIIGNLSDLSRVQTELPAGVSPWDALSRIITSIDFIKKETVRNRSLRKRWDLVIVDEAHSLSESGTPENPYRTQRTRLGVALREASRGLLFLTATPHNGYVHAFRSLLELVEPTLATFHGKLEDRNRRIESACIRRMKSQIKKRLPDGRDDSLFPKRTVSGIAVKNIEEGDQELLNKVGSYCSRMAREAAGTEEAELISFAMQIVKKRALSSRTALAKTLEHRIEALQGEETREEPPSPSEIHDLQSDIPVSEAVSERTMRKILRSAIPIDEKKRKHELRILKEIQRLQKGLGDRDPKIEALIEELKSIFSISSQGSFPSTLPSEKVIIFTEYRDTLEAIRKRLDTEPALRGSYVILTGGLTRNQRLKRQDEFSKKEIRIMLATDAASEGLNLQYHCRRVIHFELPWNPNRLEQRNGRIDRYGQNREPIIRYLYYPDSPEDDVLSTLVQKIEQIAKDRISTPDILGILMGRGEFEEGLVSLDPEDRDIVHRKSALVKLFEDRTEQFVRNVQPLFSGSNMSSEEQNRILNLLNTSEQLLSDDLELERLVLDILGNHVKKDPEREGIYKIEVPPVYRSESVKSLYRAVTFRRSLAIKYRSNEVDYITPLHPLVQALAADARRRLLQVYSSVRGLVPHRLSTRIVDQSEQPSILFTFFNVIRGDGGLVEERIIGVRVDVQGNIIGDPEKNLSLLSTGNPGDVSIEKLNKLFATSFVMMREKAKQEASLWIKKRFDMVKSMRAKQAAILRKDLEVDVNDRLCEINEDEMMSRGLIEVSGQRLLFSEQGTDRSISSRRAAVESYRKQRLEEINQFESVEEPGFPRPLGAIFLVPEGFYCLEKLLDDIKAYP
jgi:superfamily II DNA or RNA helicase